MGNKSFTNKIQKVRDLFEKLYCFSSKDIDEFMNKIKFFPEEGLDKLIEALSKGGKQQNALLTKWIGREPKYAKRLSEFVKKTANALVDDFEKKEKLSAEKILDKLP